MNDTENQQQKLHPLKYKNFFSFFQAKIKATPVGMWLLAISKPFGKYCFLTSLNGPLMDFDVAIAAKPALAADITFTHITYNLVFSLYKICGLSIFEL